MHSEKGPSRRSILGAAGIIGAATATGASLDAAAAAPLRADPGPISPVERSSAGDAKAFGPAQIMSLGAVDFQPLGNSTYEYVSPGGVRVTSGVTYFGAGLRLPVGTKLLGAVVFLNPMGGSRLVELVRYRPINPNVQILASKSSTGGNVVESVPFTFAAHVMLSGWNYRFTNVLLSAGGAILYGAQVRYQLPK